MKDFYIFLDIDGVFNCYKWLVKTGQLTKDNYYTDFHWEICPVNVKIFNKLLSTLRENNYNPKIVISSGWRYHKMQKAIDSFNKFGIDYKEPYDKTRLSLYILGADKSPRWAEIVTYLYDNHITNNYVIIDDQTDELHTKYIKPFHILQTSGLGHLGLCSKDVEKFKKELLPQIMCEKSVEIEK